MIAPAAVHHWNLELKVAGGNLTVTGLGMNSRWSKICRLADMQTLLGSQDARSRPGQLRFRRAGFPARPRRDPIQGRARPIRSSTSTPKQRSKASTPACSVQGTGLKPGNHIRKLAAAAPGRLLSQQVLFGTSITNLSAPEALQLASAVAALRSGKGSLDPINALRRAVGLDRLRIVSADVATGQKTAIGAGKYITRKLYVEVVTDGAGYSATQVEYQMTRWLSLLSTVSTIGRASATVRVSKDY